MPLFGELFVSEILKKPVLDPKGEEIGRIKDLVLVRWEPLPKVDAFILQRGKQLFKLPWSGVSIFNKKVIASSLYIDAIERYADEEDLLAVRDILDKQIVDANGAKVVRANDIKLEGYKNNAVLVAVDVGTRGILRRLGIERGGEDLLRLFKTDLPYKLISWNYLQPLHPRISEIGLTVPRQMLAELHPADLAELIEQVSHDEGAEFIKSLDLETAAETLVELEPAAQSAIIEEMDTERASDIIEEMPPDDAADLLSVLPAEKVQAILETMDKEDAEDIQELLTHEHDTAGGLMTNEFIAYLPGMSVGDAIERFKQDAQEMGRVYYIYVVDEEERLLGAVSLRELLIASCESPLSEVMEENLKTVPPDEDRTKVAETMFKYNLVAIPVVDEEGKLLGIVTIDDMADMVFSRARRRR